VTFTRHLVLGYAVKFWGLACGWDMETPNAKAFDGRCKIVICKA